MASETTRPIDDILNDWTPTGFAEAWQTLEDDDDGTYITEGAAGGVVTLLCDEPSPPAGAVMKQVRVRARVNRVFSGAILAYSLLASWNGRLYEAEGAVGVTNSTPSTITLATMTPGVAGSATPQMAMIYGGGGGVIARELYVDWTYVEVPVVTVNAPDGPFTDRNRVTVEWSDTLDSDGGGQVRYRVKIFDDTTHAGGGFDPETSTADYDSGELEGSSLSHEVDQALSNDTYWASVKVAQEVNGELLWSDWDDEDFIISVTAPAAPTVVATGDDVNARNVIVVTEATPTQIADLFVIERSLDAGSTWEAIRTVMGDGEVLIPPTIVARSEAEDTANGTAHDIAYPTPEGGLKEGDLLLAVAGMDGNNVYSWSAGWTELLDGAGNGNAVRLGAAYKWISEDGESGTLTVTTGGSQGGAIQVLAIRGADPVTALAESGSGVNGSAANSADPAAINPSGWGTENTLWVPLMAIDSDEDVTAAPTGYYGFVFSNWADDVNGAGIATAYRRERAASVDPGTWTHEAEDYRTNTIAVRPASGDAGVTVYDYEAPGGEEALYRARAVSRYATGFDIDSANSASDAATWEIGTGHWIKHPYQPELNMSPTILGRSTESRDSGAAVHKVLGREDPIVVVDGARIQEAGELVLESEDADARADLDALLDTGDPLLLQFPEAHDEPDRWVMFIGTHERARAADRSWVHIRIETLQWQEVGAPSGALAE